MIIDSRASIARELRLLADQRRLGQPRPTELEQSFLVHELVDTTYGITLYL